MKIPTRYISMLLIALIVHCPFQCIYGGCLANGLDGEVVASSACCNHCSQPADPGETPSPNLPSDCNCGDCFCRGALPDEELSQDIVLADVLSCMTSWVKLELIPFELPTSQVHRHSNALPVDASALEVRAALCCWVI